MHCGDTDKSDSRTRIQRSDLSSSQPRVAVLLVHFNCYTDTIRCLESLTSLDYPNYFVVVVDNASTDGSGIRLQESEFTSDIKLILNPENKGFAAANNVGIENARTSGAEAVWLLNPDTTVSSDALSTLVEVLLSDSMIGASGSKVLYAAEDTDSGISGSDTSESKIWSAGAEIDFTTQALHMRGNAEVDTGQFEELSTTDYLPGCSMLVPFSTIDLAGLMPEEYFMYFEETDWCTRIRRAGLTLYYQPKSVIWHHFQDVKMQQAFSVYYYNRNERLFWFRYGNTKQKLRVVLKTLGRSLPSSLRALFAAPDAAHKAVFRAHVLSCFDFLFGRFGKRHQFSR